ncbi:LiaI-LiaF-like domain-containing protein [Bacillus sp. T3]|uniref:LiaI-LiaF-like domain-containing protein n=1 Tax=Bacillus sp. T3 TaxID=467262 RepID=UPI0029815E40|nr:DUF5668 domain-containing protein [Bacillus sp. T3]
MKNQRYFLGILLIGFGGYFLLQHTNIDFLQKFAGWPTLLMIVGTAMLWQGYAGGEHDMIFPGVILFGFGLHFHVVTHLHIWPDHIGVFILIVALAFILKYQMTGIGLAQGLLFLGISAVLLFQDQLIDWVGTIESNGALILKYWPVLLIAVGLFFFMIQKNKAGRIHRIHTRFFIGAFVGSSYYYM